MKLEENTETRILFVCMGNICRSPTAEAVFRHQVKAAGFAEAIYIDSAGTHDYHIGEPPDQRAQNAAVQRGYEMKELRARQVQMKDFEVFDRILAMDKDNLAILKRQCPPQYSHKLGLLMQNDKSSEQEEVPDPYFGGPQGFEKVLDMIEKAGCELLGCVRSERLLS